MINDMIIVKNVKKYFKDVKAVDDISFTVKRGSLFAFLGLNGAGKSTTINILCSIIKKDAGYINIAGYDLDKEVNHIKNKIGIVFQGSVLDQKLTVYQNLISRASLYRMRKADAVQRIQELKKLLQLEPLLNRTYGKLSGGQRRRVDIARALIHRPEILFLDEPTTGLDPNTRVSVWQILERLMGQHELTIFLTTHYMEEVVKADRVVILDEGKIIANATPDQLKNKYTSDFVRIISEKNKSIENLLKKHHMTFHYLGHAYHVPISSLKEGLSFIYEHQSIITDYEILKGNMDDVFLNVTGKKLEVDYHA